MVAQPPVRLAVVVEDNLLAVVEPRLEHDRGLRERLGDLVRILLELLVLGLGTAREVDAEGDPREAEQVEVVDLAPRRRHALER